MALTTEEVKKIAHLAQLNISPEEITLFTSQLSNMLDLAAQMDQHDMSNVTPLVHSLDLAQPWRTDEVTEVDQHKKFQRIAPQTEAGLYLVPKVIDEA
jgi:aspartyl-tRNA(Asn)/glutamyl-tRNA(Gln) amidotransferase subunit C